VLQYRFSIDGNGNNTTDAGEVFRDWTEDPHATANPAQSQAIAMDVRCSTLQSCVGRATLGVVINDTPYLTFTDANNIKWSATIGASTYDVATQQGPGGTGLPGVTTGTSAATWLGGGGYFDGMTCNSNAQAGTTRNISAQGNPGAGRFDLWVVRKHGGSWEEIGSVPFGTVTRDTVMADTSPVCP
jgi:hypothetical protein